MQLVMLETAGNQAFIYATNKQRENIGGSELTSQFGEWAREAVGTDVLEVLITSGKAILLVDSPDPASARAVVGHVSARALDEGAGLHVNAAVVSVLPADLATPPAEEELMRRAHRELAVSGAGRPGPATRWPQHPFAQVSGVSNLPASPPLRPLPTVPAALPGHDRFLGFWPHSRDDSEALSECSRTKRLWAQYARHRMLQTLRVGTSLSGDDRDRLFPDLDDLESYLSASDSDSELSWIGVVHIDANGMGAIFSNLAAYMPDAYQPSVQAAPLVERFGARLLALTGDVSRALQACTEAAYAAAAAEVLREHTEVTGAERDTKIVPVVPIVLGGDDVTVLVHDAHALTFTAAYLHAFEELTATDLVLGPLGENADIWADRDVRPGLTSAAGVALVKRTFPFSEAYQLAEQLCNNAKAQCGRGCSSLDFHANYDAQLRSLGELRQRLQAPALSLTAAPYRLRVDGPGPHWQMLRYAAQAVTTVGDDGDRLVPRRQAVQWRDRLRADSATPAGVLAELQVLGVPAQHLMPGGELTVPLHRPVGHHLELGWLVWDAIVVSRFLPDRLRGQDDARRPRTSTVEEAATPRPLNNLGPPPQPA